MADNKINEPECSCSFCGKHQSEVQKLIAGPNVYICDECIELCNDIVREEGGEHGQAEEVRPASLKPAKRTAHLAGTDPQRHHAGAMRVVAGMLRPAPSAGAFAPGLSDAAPRAGMPRQMPPGQAPPRA